MLLIIAIVLAVLWLLGFLVINISSPLIHILLVVALVIFIYDLVTKHRSV